MRKRIIMVATCFALAGCGGGGGSNDNGVSFSFLGVFAMNGLAHGIRAGMALRKCRGLNRVKDFVYAPACLLDAIGSAVKDFEDGQGL